MDKTTLKLLGGWLLFGVIMCLLPLVVSTGTLRILIFAHFLAIFAMSWDILSGRTGYISFGHPFLIGIAGYTTAILSFRYGVPIYFSIPAAVAVFALVRRQIFAWYVALSLTGSLAAGLLYQLTG